MSAWGATQSSGGGAHDGRADLPGNADRHHVPFDELPQMNAGVEPPREVADLYCLQGRFDFTGASG